MAFRLLVFVSMFFFVSPAFVEPAAFMSGNQMLEFMRAYERTNQTSNGTNLRAVDYHNGGVFMGFVIGVYDSGSGTDFCATEGVKVQQIAIVVVNYINSHPQAWNYSAASIASNALRQAFPCGKTIPN